MFLESVGSLRKLTLGSASYWFAHLGYNGIVRSIGRFWLVEPLDSWRSTDYLFQGGSSAISSWKNFRRTWSIREFIGMCFPPLSLQKSIVFLYIKAI
jgi:hypothetical protein